MSGPDGEPVIMVVPLWAFGTPQSAQVGPATYSDLLAQFDAWVEAADGYHWQIRTRWPPASRR